MAIDPYTDPDSITALYTNPDDEMVLVEYLADAAFIQLGLVPASGRGVTNAPSTTGTGEEIISGGSEVPGSGTGGDFGDEGIWSPFKRSPDLEDPIIQ